MKITTLCAGVLLLAAIDLDPLVNPVYDFFKIINERSMKGVRVQKWFYIDCGR